MIGAAFIPQVRIRYLDDWRNVVRMLRWINYNRGHTNDEANSNN